MDLRQLFTFKSSYWPYWPFKTLIPYCSYLLLNKGIQKSSFLKFFYEMEDKIILKFKTKNILNFYEIEPWSIIGVLGSLLTTPVGTKTY